MFDGVVVTEPFLLYHDEISIGTNATSGVLTCMTESSSPRWRDVHPMALGSSSSPLQSTPSGSGLQLSRTGDPIPNDSHHNGLWSCRQLDRGAYGFIGIYNRGGGKNAVCICNFTPCHQTTHHYIIIANEGSWTMRHNILLTITHRKMILYSTQIIFSCHKHELGHQWRM